MPLNKYLLSTKISLIFVGLVCLSCSRSSKFEREEALYAQYCNSCHMAPKIEELPKQIWEEQVLPDMLSKMKIKEVHEGSEGISNGVFRPEIPLNDWVALQQYIVALAPENLPETVIPKHTSQNQFEERPLILNQENGSFISYLQLDNMGTLLQFGDIFGTLKTYGFDTKAIDTLFQAKTPITWYNKTDSLQTVTQVGLLDPSQSEEGRIHMVQKEDTLQLPIIFHRPVHTLSEDLNGDGNLELVISEFGHETGRLSLLHVSEEGHYEKKILLNLPGCIRTISKDMDLDEKKDLVVMTTQGNESITVLYQKEGLRFEAEKLLEFSPVFGNSWFEFIDYNGDGHDDIVTVNGDNADKSYVHKPYHGLRIHLNDGKNNFKEAYFYPLNGATRLISRDFDEDGDIDFALISTFPDYEKAPKMSFVYLENTNSEEFQFETRVLKNPNLGRWFLMDAGDIDGDGDDDIVLSTFNYTFTPIPDDLKEQWEGTPLDVLLLRNNLK